MQEPPRVSFPTVARLIAGLYLRRFANRLAAGLRRRPRAGRTGTGRKNAVGNPLSLAAVVAVFIFSSVSISSDAMKTLASEMGPPRDASGRIEIRLGTYERLRDYIHYPRNMQRSLWAIFSRETDAGNQASNTDYIHELMQSYDQQGLAGFTPVDAPLGFFPRLLAWQNTGQRPLLIDALGLVLLILAGARHCWTLGSRNQDLGQIEWSTEWLFCLPASSRSLFGAQILGHAFIDPFSWIGTIPLLMVVYLSSGAGWEVAVAAALANSIYLGVIMASLRIASETWLRKHLAPVRLKNLQALFTLVGIVLLFMLFALARSQDVMQWVVRIAGSGSRLLIWNPFSLPALAFSVSPAALAGIEVLCGAAIFFGAIELCSFVVRDGLVTAQAVYSGGRGTVAGPDYLPAGIIGKDLRLLLRDRNFFVQTLVAPGLIVCFQIFFNVGMAQSIGSNYHVRVHVRVRGGGLRIDLDRPQRSRGRGEFALDALRAAGGAPLHHAAQDDPLGRAGPLLRHGRPRGVRVAHSRIQPVRSHLHHRLAGGRHHLFLYRLGHWNARDRSARGRGQAPHPAGNDLPLHDPGQPLRLRSLCSLDLGAPRPDRPFFAAGIRALAKGPRPLAVFARCRLDAGAACLAGRRAHGCVGIFCAPGFADAPFCAHPVCRQTGASCSRMPSPARWS